MASRGNINGSFDKSLLLEMYDLEKQRSSNPKQRAIFHLS